MRSPITETIKRVQGMIDYVRENLDDGEYDLFLDLLVPEPEVEPVRPKRKRRSSKKSARASGMAAALGRGLEAQRRVPIVGGFADDSDMFNDSTPLADTPCTYRDADNHPCGHGAGNPIHDPAMGYGGYHEFQSAGLAATAAGD